ncbi:MAG: hypothetical protein ACKO41_00450 [Sphingomonadales bacterium]
MEPKKKADYIRLGKAGDGGYIVDRQSVTSSQKLLSFGINYDWSFESDFLRLHPVPLFAFDHSIGKKEYLKKFLIHSTFDFSAALAYHHLSALMRYDLFFKGSRVHLPLHVGYNSIDRMVDFTKALQLASCQDCPFFLKVDTEGWEYGILDSLLFHASQIRGLVIEFHRLDLHLKRVIDFIEKFPLDLVYTRANNYGHIMPDGTPLLIECTFSAFGVDRSGSFEPHATDQQNGRNRAPYRLQFK